MWTSPTDTNLLLHLFLDSCWFFIPSRLRRFNQYSEVRQNDRSFEVYYPALNLNDPIKYLIFKWQVWVKILSPIFVQIYVHVYT